MTHPDHSSNMETMLEGFPETQNWNKAETRNHLLTFYPVLKSERFCGNTEMLRAYSEIQNPIKKTFQKSKTQDYFLGHSVTSSAAQSSQQLHRSGCLFVGMQRFSFYTLSHPASES